MSFFGPPCCCKGLERPSKHRHPIPENRTLRKYFQDISKSMSFWRLKGCGREVRGAFTKLGSVLAPDARRCLELAPFWRQKARSKAGFSRVASILTPHPEVKSDYGINFDATEKFFLRKA